MKSLSLSFIITSCRFPLLLLAFCLPPLAADAQVVDTAAVRREVDSLVQACRRLVGKQQFEEALSLIEVAEEKAEAGFGRMSAEYATCAFNHGRVFQIMEKYIAAESIYLQVKDIREKVFGKLHLEYAGILNALGVLYFDKGEYFKAEPLLLEAMDIGEKVLGNKHRDYRNLHHLATLYLTKGDYDKAESLYLEIIQIQEKELGKMHPHYALSLNNLGGLYRAKGDYAKAEELFLRSKDIRENVLGRISEGYLASINRLGGLYFIEGEYAKAEPLLLEAKEITEKLLCKKTRQYATSLIYLAILAEAKGDFINAELFYLEGKDILENILGSTNQIYGQTLNHLANFYSKIGFNDKAELLYLEANDIFEHMLGSGHPFCCENLNNLATHYWSKGDNSQAIYYFFSTTKVTQTLLQKSSTYSSEHEQLQYSNIFTDRSAQFLSFLQSHPTDSLRIAAYDNALFQNNALLNAAAARERAITQADSATQAIHAEWKSCHFRLNKQYALPIIERDSVLVAMLEDKANQYEKELVRRSPAFVESRRIVSWDQVRDQLQPGQAAIEFISYRYHTPQKATDSIQYAALVLLPGDHAPTFVPLCEQRQLEAIIGQAPRTDRAEVWDAYIQRMYATGQAGQASLFELVWKPLEAYLSATKKVFFSPNGLLHRLNLGAIRDPQGVYIGQRYKLTQLGSTRRLAQPAIYQQAGNSIALFGGIHYELDSTKIADTIVSQPIDISTRSSYFATDSLLRGNIFDYLTGTKTEVDNIGVLCQKRGFQVAKFTDYVATEEAVKAIGTHGKPSPRVLHIATHGFFFPDPKTELQRDAMLNGEQIVRLSDDPMRRAGLVLAGGNYAWRTGKAFRPNMDDGILTAAEIKSINLSNTELVVLSACDTGLGDVTGNEGVYGLQRAFKIAGAKYLIMSLWSVPDDQTKYLMGTFYANWLDKKMDIPAAFTAAQLAMKKEYPSPFYWAGFVLLQ